MYIEYYKNISFENKERTVKNLIKETVDAVRRAELEAEKIISTAEDNAQGKKNQIKSEAQEYRTEALKRTKDSADRAMQDIVDKCTAYEVQTSAEIDKKAAELKSDAESRMEQAVDAVIDALV